MPRDGQPSGMASGVRLVALALIPPVLLLSHRNLVLVMVVIGLTGLAAMRPARPAFRPGHRWIWPFVALAAYLALSTLWSPSADDRDWTIRIPAVVVLIGAVLGAATQARPVEVRVFALVGLAACVLLGIEGLTGGGLRDLLPPENAADRDDVSTARGAGLAISMLPAFALCLVSTFGRSAGSVFAVIIAVALAICAVRFDVAANIVALSAAAAFAAVAAMAPRVVTVMLLGVFAASFLIMPIGAAMLPEASLLEDLTQGPVSWRQRLVIWRTVADAALSDPLIALFGAGQHASAALGEVAGMATLSGSPVPLPRVPSHPHNVFLAVWYEAGAFGSALAAAGFALGARRAAAAALPRAVWIAAAATLGAVLVGWTVDASLWTLWRAAALVLAAFGLLIAARQSVVYPVLRS